MQKILVAIANYGSRNEHYARRLIETYRGFSCSVDIVILSNIPKDFGPDVEVRVGLPSKNPWSLPFAHRPLFAERQDQYDLFIYSEDDTEIAERHVSAFLDAQRYLPEDRIAGFIRYERSPDGTVFYSTIHGHYHWDPRSVFQSGPYTFARYTNDHSACFILTRNQLKQCIATRRFLVEPHEGPYDMLCTAATDPYTSCGFEKVVPVSHLDAFCLHHLPDKYLGEIGVEKTEIDRQVTKLIEISIDNARQRSFIESVNTGRLEMPGKPYFEPEKSELIEAIPSEARRILSVGCERGLTEGRLVERGHDVTAIPLDEVIAQSAVLRGVHALSPDVEIAERALGEQAFDAILFNNVLQYLENPEALLIRFKRFLAPRGTFIIGFDNAHHLGVIKRSLRSRIRAVAGTEAAARVVGGANPAEMKTLLRKAKLSDTQWLYHYQDKDEKYSRKTLGLMKASFGRRCAVRAHAC